MSESITPRMDWANSDQGAASPGPKVAQSISNEKSMNNEMYTILERMIPRMKTFSRILQ